jgi:hypothetical protein
VKQTLQAVALLSTAAALIAGCASTLNGQRKPAGGAAPPAVACVARFTDLEADYPWFENWVNEDGNTEYGDGSSPRAVFRITEPAAHSNRVVGVLYKWRGADLPPPPALSDKGKAFSFELPADFLSGKYETIDNIDVRSTRPKP